MYSNGLGATINYITRIGGNTVEGGYKIECADYGFIRQDAFILGPFERQREGLRGRLCRRSDGICNPGYMADKGGQIRGNLVYTSDDRSLTARVDAIAAQ